MTRILRVLLRCDGTSETLAGPISLKEIRRLIGADVTDSVNLRHMGEPLHVLIVDGAGWEIEVIETPGRIELRPVRPRKPINAQATALYHSNCKPGTRHQIAGDAVVVPDGDFA